MGGTQRPMRRFIPYLVLVAILLAGIFLFDLFVITGEIPLAVLYAIPVLISAQFLPAPITAATAGVALVLYGVNLTLDQVGLAVSALNLVALAIIGYLGYLVAARIRDVELARRNLQNFMGMVAHDLRGPLTTLSGYAQLLERSDLPAERRQAGLTVIRDSAQRMNRLVTDLVDAVRIGAGSFQVRPQHVDLAALTRDTVETQGHLTPEKEIELDTPEHLEGDWDPDRLAQVMGNLLSNAAKYSPDGGAIEVRLRQEDGQAVVSVSDQGIGIKPEDLDLLFQPFSRLYAERTTSGVGLGLYISKAIVVAHGGRIWAKSKGLGNGATFSFTLPLSR